MTTISYTITGSQLQALLNNYRSNCASEHLQALRLIESLQPNTQEPVAWINTAGKSTLLTTREPHEDYGTVVEHWFPLYRHPAPKDSDEPRLSDLFCGVDVTDGKLSVSVLRRRVDDVAEVLHSEQLELPQAKPLTTEEVEQILAQHNYELHGDRARYIVRMTELAHGVKP